MAGIGVKLNKIYEKKSLIVNLSGMAYSVVVTVAPMVVVALTLFLVEYLLGFDKLDFMHRELFSTTVLYIFIFSLITTSPLNALLSRYMSDIIYEETLEEVMPCYYTGLVMNVIISMIPAVPFMLHEYFVGGIEPVFIFIGFIGYMSLVWAFYSMIYLSICKDYAKITLFYFIGMVFFVILSYLFVVFCKMPLIYGMLLGMDIGILIIASLEFAQLRSYFRESSHRYTRVLSYFKTYWPLVVANACYIFGLYVHNFVYWTTDMRMEVADSLVCAQPYDMASFLALVTNLSATVIFISGVEMHFNEYYRNYTESVIGGRLIDVESGKDRMFQQLANQLSSLVRVQFIVTVVIFLAFSILLPFIGISGLTMQIYPSLTAGYFVMFIMYSAIIFLYYYNDNIGAMFTSMSFFVCTLIGTVISTYFDYIWAGMGLFAGALIGWTIAYFRLRWVERHIEDHTFCRGSILKKGRGGRPLDVVYRKDSDEPVRKINDNDLKEA